MKYSIIIPTLWHSQRVHKLLADLGSHETVDEIILIDNSHSYYRHYDSILPKVKLVQASEGNLYVAASWNLGVRLAKNNRIAICNDDINFDPSILDLEIVKNTSGIIGQAAGNYYEGIKRTEPSIEELSSMYSRPLGWGCILLFNKSDWLDVPETLRVWFNDDFIIEFNPAKKFILNNFKIQSEMSTTTDRKEFDAIKEEDRLHWNALR